MKASSVKDRPRGFCASLPFLWLATTTLVAPAAEPGANPILPALNPSPGSEYSDGRRMFQGIPTLERAANGRLWAAWYGGGVTEDKHNYIILDTSGDDGRTWKRALILDPDHDGPVRAFDPCLWHDPQGKLWLFWAQREEVQKPHTLAIHTTDSDRAKAVWTQPRVISEGIMMNKPTVDREGRWLLPMALWRTDGSARIVASTDRGVTFARIGAANIPRKEDRNCDEPMLVQRQDGALWLLVRTRYGIGESISTNGGKTWPEVVPTAIPHPATRFFIRRLSSGNLLMVRHDPPEAARVRSHLKAFVSEDDGRSWKGGLLLDERRNVSYPDGVQAANGLIYLIYDWERQRDKEILMAIFREEDVRQGNLVSLDGRLRVRVNQATGLNPTVAPRTARDQGVPKRSLHVVSVQMPITGDMNANRERICAGVKENAAKGARVVVFPETALSGLDQETIGKIDWARLDAAMASVADTAREQGVYVIYGCATRSSGERPFNSAVVLAPDGKEITRYHKCFPEGWFEPGEHLALFEVDGIPCTVIVYHDNRFPELVRVPVLAGAKICFYISYEINSRDSALLKREGYRAQSIARAVENGIWWVQANGVGPKRGQRLSLGNSVIVSPNGQVVAHAPQLKPATIRAAIDPAAAGRDDALEGLDGRALPGWWESAVDQLRAQQHGVEAAGHVSKKSGHRLRVALMQSVPVKWDLEKNFAVFLRLLDQASGADIFVTPECWLDGYAAPDKKSTVERLRGVAQDPASSPYLARVSEEARRRNMYICFGFTSLEKGCIYNAAGLWDKTGALVGCYHKTHLQAHDLQFSPGEDLSVWQTPWGPIGIMICADRRWPETARTLRLKGARLILNPTYGMCHWGNEWWMRTRSYENQCFVAFAHPQTSFVAAPGGRLQAKRHCLPGVLLCDLDLSKATEDNHLKDRRPELYGIITQTPERKK